MIIGLSGYARSGKDEVAKMIQELQPGWEVRKFAGVLKQIASILTGIPQSRFEDQAFKETYLGKEWSTLEPYSSEAPWIGEEETIEVPMTVRDFLQKLGTDAIRNGLHPNAWVNAAMAEYYPIHHDHAPNGFEYPKWIFTDCRFPNEAQAVKDRGGVVIRIDRPGIGPVNNHPSETALDNWDFDYKILNASDLTALKQTVSVILNKIYETDPQV